MGVVTTEALSIINRLPLAAILWVLAASAWAQDPAREGGRILDLTVPPGTLTRTWGSPTEQTTARLPGMGEAPGRPGVAVGAERGGGLRGDLPYGAGYEARHGQGGGGGGRGRGR